MAIELKIGDLVCLGTRNYGMITDIEENPSEDICDVYKTYTVMTFGGKFVKEVDEWNLKKIKQTN